MAKPGCSKADEVGGVDGLPDRLAAPEAPDHAEGELPWRVVGELDPLAVHGQVAESHRPVRVEGGSGSPEQRVDEALGRAAGGEEDADRRVGLRDLDDVDGRDRPVDRLEVAVDDAVLDERGVEVREPASRASTARAG